VLALEEGDALVNKMLEQDFRENHLRERYPARMETNKRDHLAKSEQLETLLLLDLGDEERGGLSNR
jgi:hypothetical protein